MNRSYNLEPNVLRLARIVNQNLRITNKFGSTQTRSFLSNCHKNEFYTQLPNKLDVLNAQPLSISKLQLNISTETSLKKENHAQLPDTDSVS